MKKILITSNLYLPNIGGIENSLYYLAKAGEKDDVTIVSSDIIDPNNSGRQREPLEFQIFKYKVPRTKCRIYNLILHYINAFKIYKKIKENGCDVVISRFHFNTLLCKLAGLKNINYLVPGVIKYQNTTKDMNDGLSLLLTHIKYKIHSIIQYLAFRVTDKIYVFSSNMEKQIKSIYKDADITIVSPGVDYEKFYFNDLIPDKTINLLIVSRLVSGKNIEMAIESMSYLSDKYFLTIVGDGSLKTSLENLVDELKLTNRITFQGSQSDVVPFYQESHIFLLPSIYEPFGQTILEASCCGLPVVAFSSNIVNTATYDILNNYGIYATKLDSQNYANAIENAYEIYFKNKQIDKNKLRDFIIKKYSWEKLYYKLIGNSNE